MWGIILRMKTVPIRAVLVLYDEENILNLDFSDLLGRRRNL
jgi:hypothetical protein